MQHPVSQASSGPPHHPSDCSNCGRTGHDPNDCPYYDMQDNALCSNCGAASHKSKDCPKSCQISGCKSFDHRTWQHPSASSTLSDAQRKTIVGYSKIATISTDAPASQNVRTVNQHTAPRRPRPECNYASYTRNFPDDSYAPTDKSAPSVVTNYVKVECQLPQVHVYKMYFTVPQDSTTSAAPATNQAGQAAAQVQRYVQQRGERKRVFKALLTQAPLQGRRDYATDYDTLWTGTAIPTTPTQHGQQSLLLTNVQYTKQSGKQATLPQVEFVYERTLDFTAGTQALAGPVTPQHNPNELIRGLNAMVTRCITDAKSQQIFEYGTNMFFIKGSQIDITGLEIQRGYFTSVRPGENSVLLNVNITHGTFLQPISVSDFIDTINNFTERGEHKLRNDYKDPTKLLKGRAVRIIYNRKPLNNVIQDNNRIKIIAGFGDVPYIQQFEGQDKMWTVKQWFESQKLPIHARYHHLPCVNVGLNGTDSNGKSRAVWIPAHLLELEPNQAFGKQLGSFHMQKMKDIALQHPASNHAAIEEEGLPVLGFRDAQQPLLRDLQLTAGEHLLRVPATQLAAPTVVYANAKRHDLASASWNLQGVKFQKAAKPAKSPLAILDLRPADSLPTPGRIATDWLQKCKDHGLPVQGRIDADAAKNAKVKTVPLPSSASGNYALDLLKALAPAFQDLSNEPLVVVLLPNTEAMVYASVKRVADLRHGVSTICVTSAKLSKGDRSLFSNLLMKQNLKHGSGQNHSVSLKDGKSAFSEISSNTLVIGVDVVHPGGYHPSIAAMVGSVDGDYATFPGHVRLQPARAEILTQANMLDMAKACIAAYKARRGHYPSRILYYRDGVSDDQCHDVVTHEVPELERAMPAGVAAPSIVAIVVGKRHNTRFFPPNDSMTYSDFKGKAPASLSPVEAQKRSKEKRPHYTDSMNGNISPGLLVDSVITQPQMPGGGGYRDFFLQSHAALDGTARSAHYIVVRNDTAAGLSQAQLQRLSYYFCFNNARASKGVSYCAPAYYADRLCDRVHHYYKSFIQSTGLTWQKGLQETEVAFRDRVRGDVAGHQMWHMRHIHGNANPWVPKFNDHMFWL